MEREEITYPLGNSDFLRVLTNSFKEFIEKGTSRSTAKLKPLHGAIARDLAEKLGRDYTVFSQGYGIGKETKIRGRYVNKAVDITVKKGERAVAGWRLNSLCRITRKTRIIILRTCWVKLPIYDVGIVRIFKYSSYLINYRIINDPEN